MDMRSWLLDAHADLRRRMDRSVVAAVPSDRWTELADGGGTSIAWLLFHLARHQDLAVATAIRDRPPLYLEHRAPLGLVDAATWTGLSEREDRAATAAFAPGALTTYVDAVFDATTEWLEQFPVMVLDTVPDTPRRLTELAQLPADEMGWLLSMWGGRTVGWLVQWPVIGHGDAHVGEATSVRNRLGLSPF